MLGWVGEGISLQMTACDLATIAYLGLVSEGTLSRPFAIFFGSFGWPFEKITSICLLFLVVIVNRFCWNAKSQRGEQRSKIDRGNANFRIFCFTSGRLRSSTSLRRTDWGLSMNWCWLFSLKRAKLKDEKQRETKVNHILLLKTRTIQYLGAYLWKILWKTVG